MRLMRPYAEVLFQRLHLRIVCWTQRLQEVALPGLATMSSRMPASRTPHAFWTCSYDDHDGAFISGRLCGTNSTRPMTQDQICLTNQTVNWTSCKGAVEM